MTIGQQLQDLIDKKGWTQEEAADKLSVSRVTVNLIINGRRGITPDMALRLERVFPKSVTARDWLEWQASERLEAARRKQRRTR